MTILKSAVRPVHKRFIGILSRFGMKYRDQKSEYQAIAGWYRFRLLYRARILSMKKPKLKKIASLILPALLSSFLINAQVASWTFNGVLTGTGTANTTASNASLGSTIAAGGAFNGNVYYGEGNWPSGGIDLNAYLEFSITPTAGHTVTVSSLSMQIRRSTTGSSGAGPNTWSLRSSLDGYSSNLSSGVLTTSSTPATVVTLGISFINLPAKITFRLYGYNATISTGGLSRFVFDDIQAGGSSVLPVGFDYFNVKPVNQTAVISWKMAGEGNLSSLQIERAAKDDEFKTIKQYSGEQINAGTPYAYTDDLNEPAGKYAYRLKMIAENGQSSYSSIQNISFESGDGFQLKAITGALGQDISFRINTVQPGDYIFSLFNLNGCKVAVKQIRLAAGNQTLQMDKPPVKAGIYILIAENGKQTISTKVLVN